MVCTKNLGKLGLKFLVLGSWNFNPSVLPGGHSTATCHDHPAAGLGGAAIVAAEHTYGAQNQSPARHRWRFA